MTPGEFATIMTDCVKMGATLLGGCCGTAPEYIAALNTSL
jgi:methionine synthase I (cobalamin-dependent)